MATDLSTEAVAAARQKYGDLVDARVVDMAAGPPFPDAGFDVVMLERLEIPHGRTNVPLKRVWRVAARA